MFCWATNRGVVRLDGDEKVKKMVTIEVEPTIFSLLADIRDEHPEFTCSEIVGMLQILSLDNDFDAVESACQEARRRLAHVMEE